MKTYIAQRLGIAVLTLFGMSVVIFVLLRLAPGAIVDVLFSASGYVNPEEKQAIHLVLFPGIAISLAVFGANLFGDALRDTLDPRLRGA